MEALSETAREALLKLLIARMPRAAVARAVDAQRALTDEEIEMIRVESLNPLMEVRRRRRAVTAASLSRQSWRPEIPGRFD